MASSQLEQVGQRLLRLERLTAARRRAADRPEIAPHARLLPRRRRQEPDLDRAVDDLEHFDADAARLRRQRNADVAITAGRRRVVEPSLDNRRPVAASSASEYSTGCSARPPSTIMWSLPRYFPVLWSVTRSSPVPARSSTRSIEPCSWKRPSMTTGSGRLAGSRPTASAPPSRYPNAHSNCRGIHHRQLARSRRPTAQIAADRRRSRRARHGRSRARAARRTALADALIDCRRARERVVRWRRR